MVQFQFDLFVYKNESKLEHESSRDSDIGNNVLIISDAFLKCSLWVSSNLAQILESAPWARLVARLIIAGLLRT